MCEIVLGDSRKQRDTERASREIWVIAIAMVCAKRLQSEIKNKEEDECVWCGGVSLGASVDVTHGRLPHAKIQLLLITNIIYGVLI